MKQHFKARKKLCENYIVIVENWKKKKTKESHSTVMNFNSIWKTKLFRNYEIGPGNKFVGSGRKVAEIHMLTVQREPTSLARTDPFVTQLSTRPCFLRVFPARNIG